MFKPFGQRFRGFLPVVVDIETAGFNPTTDAILEIAAVFIVQNEDGRMQPGECFHQHVEPFEGANLEKSALDFIGIDPHHPFRFAVKEQETFTHLFKLIKQHNKLNQCTRSVLVGHNPMFDLSFIIQAVERLCLKRMPFHRFTTLDTATLSGMAFGQTVLAKAVKAAGLDFDANQAHSALYDAERTAQLFCRIMNLWQDGQEALYP